jgi:carbonic anhydrase/acetyltransferase-like protein (isoleucine patch superfamily)
LPREVYAQGDLAFAAAVELRAALAEGGMELADESTVLRWIHAGKHLVVGKGSRLFGRASSDDAIFLTAPTSFERLNAPTILAGRERTAELGHSETTTRIDPKDLAPHVEVHANRALVPGDVRIPADALVDVDVVALGDLHVGAKARVIGSLKAHGRILVQSGAWIEGGVVATEGVEVRAGAYVHGPLLSEESLIIGPDARIGDPDRPTTSRGRRVELHERARVHGTIWASKEGEVVPA